MSSSTGQEPCMGKTEMVHVHRSVRFVFKFACRKNGALIIATAAQTAAVTSGGGDDGGASSSDLCFKADAVLLIFVCFRQFST